MDNVHSGMIFMEFAKGAELSGPYLLVRYMRLRKSGERTISRNNFNEGRPEVPQVVDGSHCHAHYVVAHSPPQLLRYLMTDSAFAPPRNTTREKSSAQVRINLK